MNVGFSFHTISEIVTIQEAYDKITRDKRTYVTGYIMGHRDSLYPYTRAWVWVAMKVRGSLLGISKLALIEVQGVDLIGIGLRHLVLFLRVSETDGLELGHDGLQDTPVFGEGVRIEMHDAFVVVADTNVLPVLVLVKVIPQV